MQIEKQTERSKVIVYKRGEAVAAAINTAAFFAFLLMAMLVATCALPNKVDPMDYVD